jgi:hypothetical protein
MQAIIHDSIEKLKMPVVSLSACKPRTFSFCTVGGDNGRFTV